MTRRGGSETPIRSLSWRSSGRIARPAMDRPRADEPRRRRRHRLVRQAGRGESLRPKTHRSREARRRRETRRCRREPRSPPRSAGEECRRRVAAAGQGESGQGNFSLPFIRLPATSVATVHAGDARLSRHERRPAGPVLRTVSILIARAPRAPRARPGSGKRSSTRIGFAIGRRSCAIRRSDRAHGRTCVRRRAGSSRGPGAGCPLRPGRHRRGHSLLGKTLGAEQARRLRPAFMGLLQRSPTCRTPDDGTG
jgi:hypothetical protein